MSKPITTDLRRWFDQHMRLMADEELREGFGNLCAAIDATVANLELENDALYAENDALRHERDDGYVELPKDADGEPIHAGDELEGYGRTIEVVELRYGRSGWVVISRDGNAYADNHAFTHHVPDTWERIIEDAIIYAVSDTKDDRARFDALVARCRALAGDA